MPASEMETILKDVGVDKEAVLADKQTGAKQSKPTSTEETLEDLDPSKVF